MKISYALGFVALFLLAGPVQAGERINLAAPDQARAGTLSYRVVRIDKQIEIGQVGVELRGANGERREEVINDMSFMRQLLAPTRPKSELRMVMEYLIDSGRLIGTVSGTPD